MSYRVAYTASALQDIEDIFEYIARELLEPELAAGIYRSIVKAVRSLESFPNRHEALEREQFGFLRRMPVKNYLVFYAVNEENKAVSVIRIMYGARNVEDQLINPDRS